MKKYFKKRPDFYLTQKYFNSEIMILSYRDKQIRFFNYNLWDKSTIEFARLVEKYAGEKTSQLFGGILSIKNLRIS